MNDCFKDLFYYIVIDKFLRPGKKRDVLNKQERDSIMAIFFSEQNPNDLRIKGLYLSPFYINHYYNYLAYKKYNLNSIQPLRTGDKIYKVRQHEFLIKEDFVPFMYIPDEKIKEDLWALEIIGFFSWIPGKYDGSVITQYDSIFPNNKWQMLLTKQFESKYIQKNIGYNLQSPIKFVDTLKSINTINSLLLELPKNKAVFVDIWASWCGPCIAAFGYNKQLDSFLIKNGIEKLYISFDDEADSKKWKNAIQKYSLGGYHILVNESLKAEIKKNIYHSLGNEGMGIPRYILINKNGKVLVDDAISPQDFKLLAEQISITLLKN
jgi:thiol-disulfide isomerase/thioredoxin